MRWKWMRISQRSVYGQTFAHVKTSDGAVHLEQEGQYGAYANVEAYVRTYRGNKGLVGQGCSAEKPL